MRRNTPKTSTVLIEGSVVLPMLKTGEINQVLIHPKNLKNHILLI
jgi:hypothetical protein